MNADGGMVGKTLVKVFPLQHPGHGMFGRQFNKTLALMGFIQRLLKSTRVFSGSKIL